MCHSSTFDTNCTKKPVAHAAKDADQINRSAGLFNLTAETLKSRLRYKVSIVTNATAATQSHFIPSNLPRRLYIWPQQKKKNGSQGL